MLHFITYGDDKFAKSKDRIMREAQNFGFNTCTACSPSDIDPAFREKYKEILSHPRIGGYGVWRPHLIKKMLGKIKEGDYLCFIDAGCTLNPYGRPRFNEYLKMLDMSEYGIIGFQMHHLEKWYTTKEIFEYFGCLNDKDITDSGQILEGILIMKKCKHLEQIIDVWLKVIEDNVWLFSDIYNNNQANYFIDNRHCQSLFSVIRKLYGCVLIPLDETFDTVVPWGSNFYYPVWATRIRG